MATDVAQARRTRVFDQHTEHAASAGEIADRTVGGAVDAFGDELLELAALLVELTLEVLARAGLGAELIRVGVLATVAAGAACRAQ